MNLYEFFLKLNHPAKRSGWEETTAYFTGERRVVPRGRGRRATVMTVTDVSCFHEYKIRYYTRDEERTGWYLFYPGPEPDPEEIKGLPMKIRYKRSKPWIFENISESERSAE